MAKKSLKSFGKKKVYVASWARWDAQWRGLVELERRCQDISREIQVLSKRQEMFQNAIEGKLRVQSRASERVQDQIIEKIKEMEHTKTEEALQLAVKEHDLWMHQNEKKMQKDCRAPGNRGRMEIWFGRHHETMKMARLGRGEKDGTKRVEAGA